MLRGFLKDFLFGVKVLSVPVIFISLVFLISLLAKYYPVLGFSIICLFVVFSIGHVTRQYFD